MMTETDSAPWGLAQTDQYSRGGYAQTDSTRYGYAQTKTNDKKEGRMAQIETEGQTDRYGYAQSKATSFAFAQQSETNEVAVLIEMV